jgi:acid phosphatase (class A)
MKISRRLFVGLAIVAPAGVGGFYWSQQHTSPNYLGPDTREFVALFAPPPSADSAQTRQELDELLEIQRTRTEAQSAAARADSSTDVDRFADALGLKPGATDHLPHLKEFAQRVEDSFRPYVRAAKQNFKRARPYANEPRLEPCLDHPPRDASYPSGHATFAFVMAAALSDVAPARASQLQARAEEFAHQRMVCGVHFRSDIEGGRLGARWLIERLRASPDYRADVVAATAELRSAGGG